MASKLKKTITENVVYDLHKEILSHCSGMTLTDVACFVGALACFTLQEAAEIANVDVKLYLLDFSSRLRETIEETLKDYTFKP